MRFVTMEVRATEQWKVYEEQFEKMVGLYELHKVNPVTICDSYECSNPDSSHGLCRSRRCSGCGVKYYCSSACQRTDWDRRHRENCRAYQEARQLNGGVSQAVDSRDVHFLNYITHDVMCARRHEDHTLARDIDFTLCPPKVSLSYVVEEEYSVYEIGIDDSSERTPMSFTLPMGLNPVQKSCSWNCHALGMEALGGLGGLAYDSETFSFELETGCDEQRG
ncbi:hypothetical protein BDZ89DRAFT_359549 [Hymenopellis radicata]|nr:hypothetical protein BDZ89DRAFT_359549 [Hymenopellis radicata]